MMRMMLAVVVLMSGAAFAADAGGGVDLRPIWKQGQASRYQLTQMEVTRMAIEGIGQPQESTTQITGQISWKIDRVDENGGGVAIMTMDTLTMKMTGPDGQVIEVSERKADSPAAKALQPWINAMVGSPLKVTVEADGKIGTVDGWRAIAQKAGEGSKIDELYFQEVAMDLAVLVGGKKDQQPGATWNHRYTGSHRLGKVDYDNRYELSGIEQIAGVPIAVVQRTSKMKFEPDLTDLPADAPKVNVKTRQASNTSQIMFDTTRHEIVGMNIDQALEIEIGVNVSNRNIIRTTSESTSTQLLRIEEK